MLIRKLWFLISLTPFVSGCAVTNFAMNVEDRVDISNIFSYMYTEDVLRLQARDPAAKIPTFLEWAKTDFRDRATYGKYLRVCLKYPKLNGDPVTFTSWAKLIPEERPEAKKPRVVQADRRS